MKKSKNRIKDFHHLDLSFELIISIGCLLNQNTIAVLLETQKIPEFSQCQSWTTETDKNSTLSSIKLSIPAMHNDVQARVPAAAPAALSKRLPPSEDDIFVLGLARPGRTGSGRPQSRRVSWVRWACSEHAWFFKMLVTAHFMNPMNLFRTRAKSWRSFPPRITRVLMIQVRLNAEQQCSPLLVWFM